MDAQKEIVANDRAMLEVVAKAKKASTRDMTVLLVGETGVGKDLVARMIHRGSRRWAAPFLPINCGAVPDSLFESEFFGHERGAFTNAYEPHRGYFEQANGGTLFLDEVSELTVTAQIKLLRVLESKELLRLGGTKNIKVDVRIIAATNRDLWEQLGNGNFRQDLYYRLAVWTIAIPPLRHRPGDILPLCNHFLDQFDAGRIRLDSAALTKLEQYHWPGNVRELESCLLRALLNCECNGVIGASDIVFGPDHNPDHIRDGDELIAVFRNCGGSVQAVASTLGVHRNTIYYRVKKLGLSIRSLR